MMGFLQDINQFSPDYVDIDQEEAFVDYKKRIAHYEETYEQICENSDSERCDFSRKLKLFEAALKSALREKCPDTEFFLVRIFPHSD